MRKILFMQGDQSDLHTVAALDKSDVPDLPDSNTYSIHFQLQFTSLGLHGLVL